MAVSLSRRDLMRGMAALTASAAAARAVTAPHAAHAANIQSASATPGGARVITSANDVAWDKAADFVVVGSGCGCYGALGATEAGCTAIIVEKSGVLGGTARLSGACCWVPGNKHQVVEWGQDLPSEQIVKYLEDIDTFHGGPSTAKKDYVANAAAFFSWAEDAWGFKQDVYTVLGDYQDTKGCKAMGRSLIHVDDAGEFIGPLDFFAQRVEPLLEKRGVEVLLNTTATNLVLDESGRAVGLVARDADGSELLIHAGKGVLLACGGFDRNPAMRAKYLRGPIFGCNSVEGNTGDGIVMGMRAGADLANMGSVWQQPYYVTAEGDELSMETDWFEYAGLPGAIVVNSKGKRFCSENTAYGAADLAFYAYDTVTFDFENLPAWLICDADHVANYGWPGYNEEQPSWFAEYASLEELASACGIDGDGLAAEVERFNGFAERGTDEDWHRGEGNYGPINVAGYSVERPELANPCMAPLATPPFYAAMIGPGSCGGTCGGLVVNLDAQVLNLDGEPIDGLYAAGNTSASPFGSAYPGAGGTIGSGFYRAFRAANHACGLGMFK